MISFHSPTPADFAWVREILKSDPHPGADYTFHNMLFWQGYYGKIARMGGLLTQAAAYDDKLFCLYPVGVGDKAEAVTLLREDAERRGLRLVLRGLTDETLPELEDAFADRFAITPFYDAFDYIYAIEELCTLSGRHLQSKRNHCNRFISEHPNWHTEKITAQNAEKCAELCDNWFAHHPSGRAADNERYAVSLALQSYDSLQMDGLLLYAEDSPVAFSMGSRMAGDYYDVNFEKAYSDVTGAYAMINREFSRMIAEEYPDVRFLNREDDMGLEGLRKAKSSYRPTVHLRKYFAEWE